MITAAIVLAGKGLENLKSKHSLNLIVAVNHVEIIRVVPLTDLFAQIFELFAGDAAPKSGVRRQTSTEDQPAVGLIKGFAYQCFHLQEPCSPNSSQLPKRGSPFMILTPSFL